MERSGAPVKHRSAGVLPADSALDRSLRALATALGRPEADVRREAAPAWAELSSRLTPVALRLWALLERLGARAYRLDVDPGPLRHLAPGGPLVFLPSHRSYLDPLILREVLGREGFPPNHVLGGVNVAFWPLGPLGRRAGYVFIRRDTSGDPVYRAVLRWYVGRLTETGANLEWYLEGGRTRTGRLRRPRLGLLAYLVGAYREGRAEGAQIVPVSIIYDLLYEVDALAAEEAGTPKAPESFRWAWRYAKAQRRRFGSVHIRFGEPLALADALGPEAQPLEVERLTFEVCRRINQVSPVTPTALVCLAAAGAAASFSEEELRAGMAPLEAYLSAHQVPVTGRARLADVLAALVDRGTFSRQGSGPAAVYTVVRPFEAAYYGNGAAPHFLSRAVAELVLAGGPEGEEAAVADAMHLRRLLSHEMVFASRAVFRAEVVAEMARARDPGPLGLAPVLLGPSIRAYHRVAQSLAALGAGPADDGDGLVARAWGPGLSHDSLRAGLRAAAQRGLLRHPDGRLAADRSAFAAEMGALQTRLGRARDRAPGSVAAVTS